MKGAFLAVTAILASAVCLGEEQNAIFAGGCFWCMEEAFEKIDGVTSVVSGYVGGNVPEPSYEEVTSGTTGHAEAILVKFDPEKVGYEGLLEAFWRNIDPTTPNQQFCDRGSQYRSGIFYSDPEQKRLAELSLEKLQGNKPFDEPIATEITEAGPFYLAEDYHQDYYKKNPLRYRFYKFNCGRTQRLEAIWGEAESG